MLVFEGPKRDIFEDQPWYRLGCRELGDAIYNVFLVTELAYNGCQ